MPVPIVAVEIAEPRPDRSPELSAVLLAACNDALRQGTCVLAEERAETSPSASESPVAVARITWSQGRARVEVLASGEPGLEKRARELEFSDTHPPIERWRSVGFVAGTLANPSSQAGLLAEGGAAPDHETAAGGGPTVSEPTSPSSAREGASDSQAPTPIGRERFVAGPRMWVDIGPTTGPGFAESPWRLGGFFSLAYAVRSSFVQASLSYSAPPEDETGLSARWITPGLGAGYSLVDLSMGFSLKVRTELLLENTYVTVSTPDGLNEDSGEHWAGGLRVGGDISWNAVPGIGLFLGADVAAFTGRVHVDVAGTRRATTPALRPSVFGGARLTLPLSGPEKHARVER